MSVVGARPQFIKLGPVSRALKATGVQEIIVHTGQHYDREMSSNLFAELALPDPDINLEISRLPQPQQLGSMIPALTAVMNEIKPDLVLVFGDTTSTIAAAVSAVYAKIPVAHVEAGMRVFDLRMPEEISRVVTDRVSTIWFTASDSASRNLQTEGLGPAVFSGDVMYDVVLGMVDSLTLDRLEKWQVEPNGFFFATSHRAENTDNRERLYAVIDILAAAPLPVIFSVHPRTRVALQRFGLMRVLDGRQIRATGPLPYLDAMLLTRYANRVVTDSGGLQKEALYLGTPCTTLRESTEWTETLEGGWNTLVGVDRDAAQRSFRVTCDHSPPRPYGHGNAGQIIAEHLRAWLQGGG